LGWLFKSRSSTVEKSNLLLFITPKIMRQPENVRAVLDKKLKERDEFVERHFGGDDEHREQRNNLIRGLPEVKSITNYNRRRLTDLNDAKAVKEKAKEAAALDQGEAYEGVTPGGQETLTLPPAEVVPTTPSAPVPESNLSVPPPTVATAPGSLPAAGAPTEAPALSQPADSNFAPISPGSTGPVTSDPFGESP
jgi:general secretion pathway protein D